MANNEILGRCSCPICGASGQDVKRNINNKLYGYCDHGCAFKFNSAQSRRLLPELAAGRNVKTETGLIILSTKNKELEKDVEETKQFEPESGRTAGVAAGRRPDGGAAAVAAGSDRNAGKPAGRTWLAELFGDDDSDE